MIKCPKCGYQNNEKAKFCINCGKNIGGLGKEKSEHFVFDIPKIDFEFAKKDAIEDIFQINKKNEKAERRKRWLEQQRKIRKELKTLDKKEETLQQLTKKIEQWKNEGYNVSRLEEVIYKKDIEELNEIFAEFEEDIQILKEIKAKLERLDTTGFEEIVEHISASLNDPESKSTILEQVMMLEEKIKDRKKKREEYKTKIENWKNEGYDVEILETSFEKGIEEIDKEFEEFEKNILVLKELEKNVLDLEAKGFDVSEIKSKLNDVSEVDFIKEKIFELQRKEKELGPWYLIGRDLYELGNYKEAIKYFDKALQKHPENEMIQKIRNICFEKSAFKEELKIEGVEVKEMELKEDIEELYSKGVDFGSLGNYDEAIKYFDKVLEMEPNHEKALFNKGWAYEDMGKLEKALECYEKLIEINPKNSEAWYNKSFVLQKLNRDEEALNFFDDLLLIESNNADILANKGTILGKLGRFYEAYECFDRATELSPFNADFWNKKAMVLYKLNRYKEALESCNKALEIEPDNQSAMKGKSMCLKKLNKSDINI